MEEVTMYKDNSGCIHATPYLAEAADKRERQREASKVVEKAKKEFLRVRFVALQPSHFTSLNAVVTALLEDGPIWDHFLELKEIHRKYKKENP